MAASGVGVVGSVLGNAAISGTDYLANCVLAGEKGNLTDLAMSVTIGGATGALNSYSKYKYFNYRSNTIRGYFQ